MNLKHSMSLVALSLALSACGGGSGAQSGGTDVNTNTSNGLSLMVTGASEELAGDTVTLTFNAANPGGGMLHFEASGAPFAASPPATFEQIDMDTARLTWQTTAGQAGQYNVTVTVNDDSDPVQVAGRTTTIRLLDEVAFGRELYRDNCGDCHGFEGTPGTRFSVDGAPASAIIDAIATVGAMSGFRGQFNATEIDAMAAYLCSLPGTVCQ